MTTVSHKEHERRTKIILEYLTAHGSAQTQQIADGVGLRRYSASRILTALLKDGAVSRRDEYEILEKKRRGARWALAGTAATTLPKDRTFKAAKPPPKKAKPPAPWKRKPCKRTAEGKARRNAAHAERARKRSYIRTATKLAPILTAVKSIASGTTAEIAEAMGEEFHCVKRCLSMLRERGQVAAEKKKVRKGYKTVNVWKYVNDTPQDIQRPEYQPRKTPLYDPDKDAEHMAWMSQYRQPFRERNPWVQW